MNRPNRHMRYRRSVYRKKRIKLIAVCSVCAVVVIALLFLIIGNLLGDKVEENVESRKSANETVTKEDSHSTPKSVIAFPVPLSDASSSLSSRLKKAAADGYSEICFELDSADGALLYSSDVAQRLGKQSSGSGLWKLNDATELTAENGLYSIGVTHVSDFSGDDDLIRSAALGYHSALISEALRSGVDEVLIFAGDIPPDRYAELARLALEVKRLCPDGIIGISLPVSAFADAQNSTVIDELWNAFDYFAADLTHCTGGEVGAAEQISGELGQMLYYLLRYNARVLLPYTQNADELSLMIAAVNDSGSENIQIMPQSNT